MGHEEIPRTPTSPAPPKGLNERKSLNVPPPQCVGAWFQPLPSGRKPKWRFNFRCFSDLVAPTWIDKNCSNDSVVPSWSHCSRLL